MGERLNQLEERVQAAPPNDIAAQLAALRDTMVLGQQAQQAALVEAQQAQQAALVEAQQAQQAALVEGLQMLQIRGSNSHIRAWNGGRHHGERLQRLHREVPGPHFGELPGVNVSFPETIDSIGDLTVANLNALENFYGVQFSGENKRARLNSLRAFIGFYAPAP
jgi:hypothetical protein